MGTLNKVAELLRHTAHCKVKVDRRRFLEGWISCWIGASYKVSKTGQLNRSTVLGTHEYRALRGGDIEVYVRLSHTLGYELTITRGLGHWSALSSVIERCNLVVESFGRADHKDLATKLICLLGLFRHRTTGTATHRCIDSIKRRCACWTLQLIGCCSQVSLGCDVVLYTINNELLLKRYGHVAPIQHRLRRRSVVPLQQNVHAGVPTGLYCCLFWGKGYRTGRWLWCRTRLSVDSHLALSQLKDLTTSFRHSGYSGLLCFLAKLRSALRVGLVRALAAYL